MSQAFITVPVIAETASNDWERGFETGLRLAEAGVVEMAHRLVTELQPQRPPRTAMDIEIVYLLRSIDRRLSHATTLVDFDS